MSKLLVPCEDSPHTRAAVRRIVDQVRRGVSHEIHLVNVQPPFSDHVARHVDQDTRRDFQREQSDQALAPARQLLDAAGVRYQVHRAVGDKARCIAQLANRLGCDRIVLGTARKSGLVRVLQNSLTSRMLEHSAVPVEVITAQRAPALERLGIPAGVGAGLTLLWVT